MAEGSQFNFWAPGQIDTSGVQSGAASLLRGGEAKASGIAAAGQAMGQAYANIGTQIGGAIEKKAAMVDAEKKEEERNTALNDFFTMSEDPDNWVTDKYTDLEETDNPTLAGIFDKYKGMPGDADANDAMRHGELTKYFQTNGKSLKDAQYSASGLVEVKEDRYYTPEARAKVLRHRGILIEKHDVNPQALQSLASSRGTRGSPDGQSAREARKKRATIQYDTWTPAEKARLAARTKAKAAAQEEQLLKQKHARVDMEINTLTHQPISMPGPEGGMQPTGLMKPRGAQDISVSEFEPGVREQFTKRAIQAGYDPKAVQGALDEEMPAQFLGHQSINEIRSKLRTGKGLSDGAIDAYMARNKLFTGPNDPAYREMMNEKLTLIEKKHLASEAPIDNSAGYTKPEDRTIERMHEELTRNVDGGVTVKPVAMSDIENIDMKAVITALGANYSDDKAGTLTLELDENRDVVIKSGRGLNDVSLADANLALKGLLNSRAIREEVMIKSQTGAVSGNSQKEMNLFADWLRGHNKEQFDKLFERSVQGFNPGAAPAPAKPPTTPKDTGRGGLDVGEAALSANVSPRRPDPTTNLMSGAQILGKGESFKQPPTTEELAEIARENSGMKKHDPAALRRAAGREVKGMQTAAIKQARQGRTGFAAKLRKEALALQAASERGDWTAVQEILGRMKGK